MFTACYNGANNAPADPPACSTQAAAVFDFGTDGDIDEDDFDTFAHCYHGPDEDIACADEKTTEPIPTLAPTDPPLRIPSAPPRVPAVSPPFCNPTHNPPREPTRVELISLPFCIPPPLNQH